ncbi:hypothetical protein CHCC20488_0383 [Bacillus paralicheniformis]|uniref:Uncharacterized protein n=1 Tax=Bacillus paralicheniformis TaxID=1648923 RepID=A0ABY3G0V7_9BACI|nr:hypothetical protein CHCC5023_3526 [Bacillus paralicheniformis]TWJ63103.1 hypothetical protein CHCC5021_1563 [Bacillus paralicheniformis]TWJ79225.1 hypothetical protein CHCC5019_0188 [Bacillus paralicheniformis]TWJ79493.1 hypothetical protein CHCC20497_4189 [Bacillus paralicheniformis]TWK24820.1 hypothetical protein CHCC20372_2348 [Bacillus paralicheniformis]
MWKIAKEKYFWLKEKIILSGTCQEAEWKSTSSRKHAP